MKIILRPHDSARPLLLRWQRRERGAPVLVAEVARRRGVGVGEAAAEEVALVGKLVDAHVAAAEPAHAVVGAEGVAAVQHPPVVEDEHLAGAQPAAHRRRAGDGGVERAVGVVVRADVGGRERLPTDQIHLHSGRPPSTGVPLCRASSKKSILAVEGMKK